jgi:transcriptional regulator with PAS, ATPase and Fis domain
MREQLQTAARVAMEQGIGWREFRKAAEAAYLAEVLSVSRNNQCRAAVRAKVHRNTLGRAIRKEATV